MKRSDGYETFVCNGCGTIPIYNESKRLFQCPSCDGPVRFIGDGAGNMELLPANKRSLVSFSKVEMPYSMKAFEQELSFFMNISMKVLTERNVKRLRGAPLVELTADQARAALEAELPELVMPETTVAEVMEKKEEPEVSLDDLTALGAVAPGPDAGAAAAPVNTRVLNAAVEAAVNAVVNSGTTTSPERMNAAAVNAAVNAAVAAARNVPAEAAAPNAAAVQPVSQNLTLVPAASLNTAAPAFGAEGLEEADLDMLPEGEPVNAGINNAGLGNSTQAYVNQANAAMNQRSFQQGGAQGVNVQTSTQPVLVVPLSVGNQAPPAQFIPPPAPGAPPTFAVDTDERSMAAAGLSGGWAPRSRPASRSSSPRGPAPPRSRATSNGVPESIAPNTKVTVTKSG